MDLKGKKLLILGGASLSIDIVHAAREMGVYTIVTDWYDTKRSPAKLIADEYWNEEIFKPDLLAKLIKKTSYRWCDYRLYRFLPSSLSEAM